MPIEAPILDDRRFDELLVEAQQRIVRYAPEWTDFNDSDPGMTLVQLFAWLTEMMLHRLNQVPERNYIKFLQLLNMELEPALPARSHVTFVPTLEARQFGPIPLRTQIQAPPPAGNVPLIFEATESISLVKRPLRSIQVFDGNAFTKIRDEVQTEGRADSTATFYPFGFSAEVGSAIYFGFEPQKLEVDTLTPQERETSPVFPDVTQVTVFDAPPRPASRAEPCEHGFETPPPRVRVVWEYQQHHDDPAVPRPWRRIDLLRDDSAAFTRGGRILLQGPKKVAVLKELGKIREPRIWIRCRLESGSYNAEEIPEIDTVLTNTVEVENLTTIQNEFLGDSDGVPDQRFTLARRPVFKDSLKLDVITPNGDTTTWKRVDDFLASGRDDEHYTLNHNRGDIHFGDGQRGKIPFASSQIVAREYRTGGGPEGNIPAGVITQAAVTGVDSVFNYRAAAGGRAEQTIGDLKQQAPQVLRSRDRAVTAEDFTALAKKAPGVLDAVAVPGAHPDYPGVRVPGAVTVVVIADNDEVPPQLRPAVKEQVCAFLDRRRLITTELFVEPPKFILVDVTATVITHGRVASDLVKQRVLEVLDDLLNPFSAGSRERRAQRERETGQALTPVFPLGRDFYPAQVIDAILNLPEVIGVNPLRIRVKGELIEKLTEPRPIGELELVYGSLEQMDITVRPDPEGAR